MEILDSPLINTMLALGTIFLGLSLLVQVLQEVYKFITKSKARAYNLALIDFAGPWISKLYQPGVASDLVFRGPFQILRRRPTGKLLPMEKDNLIKILKRTAPDWHKIALNNMETESKLQAGKEQPPSLAWVQFLKKLASVEKRSTGHWNSQEVIRFLEGWGHNFPTNSGSDNPVEAPSSINASSLLTAFRGEFFSHLDHIDEYYSQFMNNFEHTYRRQNLRLTFVIGLLLAIGFNLPFDRIYQNASRLSETDTIKQANAMTSLYNSTRTIPQAQSEYPDSTFIAQFEQLVGKIGIATNENNRPLSIDWAFIQSLWRADIEAARSILGCIITALLIGFGAPFWNDLVGSLTRLKQPNKLPSSNIV